MKTGMLPIADGTIKCTKLLTLKIMKKNIILAVALAVICLNNMFAQENEKINASVIRNFERKFAGASNVKWQSQPKGISLTQFRFENETWVAYYNAEGQLITSGRMIKSADTL